MSRKTENPLIIVPANEMEAIKGEPKSFSTIAEARKYIRGHRMTGRFVAIRMTHLPELVKREVFHFSGDKNTTPTE